jgi:acyl carrier protein
MKVHRENVLSVIRDCIALCPVEMTDESRIIEELGADSLDCVFLIVGLEDTFDIVIADEEAEKVRTIGEAVTLVIEKAKSV